MSGELISCAQDLSVDYNSSKSIMKIYRDEGRSEKRPHAGGPHRKLSDEDVDALVEEIEKHPDMRLIDMVIFLKKVRDKSVSQMTVSRALERVRVTFKRITLIPERRNDPTNMIERREYAFWFLENAINYDFYFLDEAGFSWNMRSLYGWAYEGERANLIVGAIKTGNVSLIACVNKSGVVFFEANTHSTNSAVFADFIDRMLKTIKDEKTFFIMDNVRIHKTAEVRSVFEHHKMPLKFLPPYSPQLNPIENTFAKWKALVRRRNCNDTEELISALTDASDLIREEDMSGYYSNMMRYIIMASEGKPFLN